MCFSLLSATSVSAWRCSFPARRGSMLITVSKSVKSEDETNVKGGRDFLSKPLKYFRYRMTPNDFRWFPIDSFTYVRGIKVNSRLCMTNRRKDVAKYERSRLCHSSKHPAGIKKTVSRLPWCNTKFLIQNSTKCTVFYLENKYLILSWKCQENHPSRGLEDMQSRRQRREQHRLKWYFIFYSGFQLSVE